MVLLRAATASIRAQLMLAEVPRRCASPLIGGFLGSPKSTRAQLARALAGVVRIERSSVARSPRSHPALSCLPRRSGACVAEAAWRAAAEGCEAVAEPRGALGTAESTAAIAPARASYLGLPTIVFSSASSPPDMRAAGGGRRGRADAADAARDLATAWTFARSFARVEMRRRWRRWRRPSARRPSAPSVEVGAHHERLAPQRRPSCPATCPSRHCPSRRTRTSSPPSSPPAPTDSANGRPLSALAPRSVGGESASLSKSRTVA